MKIQLDRRCPAEQGMLRLLRPVLLATLMATAGLAISLEDLDNIVTNNPDELCGMTECVNPYSSDECPQGTRWVDGVFMGGCCGGCVQFQQENEACTGKIDDTQCCQTTDGVEVWSGYGNCEDPNSKGSCDSSTKKSFGAGSYMMSAAASAAKNKHFLRRFQRSLDRSADLEPVTNILYSSWCDYGMYCSNDACVVEYDWVTCLNTREAYDRDMNTEGGYVAYRDDYRYRPECDTDELKFAPKQCKSSANDYTKVCVCVNEQGETIDGKAFSFQGDLYDDMNCLCSRRKHELQQSGDTTTTLHCQTNGNYEELQCEDGWCYCVHTNNGSVYGYQMPEPAMNLLPCFNRTLIGDQYLRQCESSEHAHNVFIKTMTEKGILVVPASPATCALDGSYAARHCDGSSCSCFSKYNADCITNGDEGCACMADKLVYDEYGKSYTSLKCANQAGSYDPVQEYTGQKAIYLVDSDGIRSSSVVAEACEDSMRPSDYQGCQVAGNVKETNDSALTFCESGCITTKGDECSPSMYMFNIGEFDSGSTCV